MNNLDRLRRVFRNPKLLARGINRAYHRRGGLRSEYPRGIRIFEEDWDTLIVLDACRYDMFESACQIDGKLSSRVSKGSSTAEWLQANFDGRDLRDTVYVTANPQLERNREHWEISLHEMINVWLDKGWDNETGTVRAETMTQAAVDAHERFPNKRIVVHYMQPHYPFVPSETEFDKKHLQQLDSDDRSPTEENVWNQKFLGELSTSKNKLWSMYLDNLEYVLEHVEKLLQQINGKIVVTADHGNYVGERAFPIPIHEYGHPRGLYDDVVVHVPWLEYESSDRREVVSSENRGVTDDVETDVVADRLRDLGYRE